MSKENSDIIYHYTSVESCLKILTSRKLWLSSITEMNDYKEGVLDLGKLKSLTQNYFENEDKEKEEFEKYLDTSIAHFKSSYLPHICCFTKEEDKLSQWRGYGDDGEGIAIGFDKQKLLTSTNQVFAPIPSLFAQEIFDVMYEEEPQHKSLMELIDRLKKYWLNHKEIRGTPYEFELTNFLAKLPLQHKSEGFKEENEVRLVKIIAVDNGSDEQKFRCVNSNIISYLEYEFSPLAISELRLGPKCKLKVNSRDFQMFIKPFKNLTIPNNPMKSLPSLFKNIHYSKLSYR